MHMQTLAQPCSRQVLPSDSQKSRSHTPYHLHTAWEPPPHPAPIRVLTAPYKSARMRRNRLVDNGVESELRYWFKCAHVIAFAAGEGMIKSTGAAHKRRSAGFRFSARIMCCRTFRLWEMSHKLQLDFGLMKCLWSAALNVLWRFWNIGVLCSGWSALKRKTCTVRWSLASFFAEVSSLFSFMQKLIASGVSLLNLTFSFAQGRN